MPKIIQEKLRWEKCFVSLWTWHYLLLKSTMTLVVTKKPSTISLHHHAERKGLADPNSQGPIQSRAFESQELFALWVAVFTVVVEPVSGLYFLLSEEQWFSNFSMHLNSPKGSNPQMSRFLSLYIGQFAFLASSQMKPQLLLWEPRNHFLSDQPDLSSITLNWPMGRQCGIRLLTTFQFTLPSFIVPIIGSYTLEDNECIPSIGQWDSYKLIFVFININSINDCLYPVDPLTCAEGDFKFIWHLHSFLYDFNEVCISVGGSITAWLLAFRRFWVAAASLPVTSCLGLVITI